MQTTDTTRNATLSDIVNILRDERTCTDHRCSEGITECEGCNGWGVITGAGRKYRRRSGARNIPTARGKRDHAECSGSGMVVCGCTPVTAEQLAEARGELLAVG